MHAMVFSSRSFLKAPQSPQQFASVICIVGRVQKAKHVAPHTNLDSRPGRGNRVRLGSLVMKPSRALEVYLVSLSQDCNLVGTQPIYTLGKESKSWVTF